MGSNEASLGLSYRRTSWLQHVLASRICLFFIHCHRLTDQNLDNSTFIKGQLLRLLQSYVALDVLGHLIRRTPYGQVGTDVDLFSESLPRQMLMTWLLGFSTGYQLVYPYYICSTIAVASGLTEPQMWPSYYGSWVKVYTLRKFWGKIVILVH